MRPAAAGRAGLRDEAIVLLGSGFVRACLIEYSILRNVFVCPDTVSEKTPIPNLSKKVIFITGGWSCSPPPAPKSPSHISTGTAGIGKATVFALAAHRPARIYFTGRNASAGSAVISEAQKLHFCACPPLTFIQCDVSSSRESIRAALADKFHSSRLDILIANAGVMAIPPGITDEGFELQYGTNYLGHAVMLQLLRPLMLRTAQDTSVGGGGDVRFVAVSSFGHTMAPSSGIKFEKLKLPDASTKWQGYGQSKPADILLAKGMDGLVAL